MNTLLKTVLTTMVFTLFTGMNFDEIIDYLSAGKELDFNNEKYELKWSSHPSGNYYKQEYLKTGEDFDSFQNMVMIEAMEGETEIKDALNAKVSALENRKKSDNAVTYRVHETTENQGNKVLEFVLSDGRSVYEWNLYRYQIQKGKGNKNYLVLFAYCHRNSSYDDNNNQNFYKYIDENREILVEKLQSYSVPEIKIVD